MSETNDRPRKKHPWRWVLFTLLLLSVLSFVGFRVAGSSQLKRELEAIRKRGLPTTALELDDWYKRVPATENAALGFIDAAALHIAPAAKNDPNSMPFKPAEQLTPKLAQAVVSYVSANDRALVRMSDAAALPKSRYPIDMSKGAETLLPHLAPVKQLAQLSKWAAIQRAKDVQTDEAVRILKNGFALTATLETEPIMISELVRIASVTLLVQGMEQALFESDFTEAQLRQLAEMVAAAETSGTNSMLRVIAGERAFGLAHMEASFKQFSRSWGSGGPNFNSFEDVAKVGLFGSRKVLGLHARDKAFFLETTEAWENAAQLDYPEMWRESERVFKEAEERMEAHPIRYLISRLILPSMGGFTKKEVYLEARLRCARTALAIQIYRARHDGKLPNLGELVPGFLAEIPRDPADNQPLEYRTGEDKGYRIIAVTSTEMLNEGRKPTNRVDVCFTVKR